MGGDAEIESEVDRLLREYKLGDTVVNRRHLRQHVLGKRGMLPSPARPGVSKASIARMVRLPGQEALDRFAEATEKRVAKLEADRRAKHRTQASKRGKVAYSFAPVPDVWVDHMMRYFPDKATCLLSALMRFSKSRREFPIPIRDLAQRTGFSQQTVLDLLWAFQFCDMLRIGKMPSGNRKVKRRNLYRWRPTTAWHLERAKRVRYALRERREIRKQQRLDKAAGV